MKFIFAAVAVICGIILILGIGTNTTEPVIAGIGIISAAGAAVT